VAVAEPGAMSGHQSGTRRRSSSLENDSEVGWLHELRTLSNFHSVPVPVTRTGTGIKFRLYEECGTGTGMEFNLQHLKVPVPGCQFLSKFIGTFIFNRT
jgi:hypothetical protein